MDFLDWLADKFSQIADSIIGILPKSPISYLAANPTITHYLEFVNWFIPIYLWISLLEAWLTAIGIYFVVQVVLRWIKVVE